MKIKLLSEGAKMPKKASSASAGYDLYVPADTMITIGRNVVKLGIAMEIPNGYEGHIRPRSGFSLKGMEGYSDVNGIRGRYDADVIQGTIDADYRGEIGVIIKSNEFFVLEQGTRIAQIVFEKCLSFSFDVVDELDDNDRGGGFGHTGVK